VSEILTCRGISFIAIFEVSHIFRSYLAFVLGYFRRRLVAHLSSGRLVACASFL
jgi:hypothetical protein